MFQKDKPDRNPKYLRWVKSQLCVVSAMPADDPHHLIGHGMGGMGTKVSDYLTFPLTRLEHSALHQRGWREWESQYDSQWRHVTMTLLRAIREGAL